MHPQLQPFVEEAWSLLPAVSEFPDQALPDVDDLNFFDDLNSFRTATSDNGCHGHHEKKSNGELNLVYVQQIFPPK